MGGWLSTRWEDARARLWFLPSVLVAAAVALALGLLRVDAALDGLGSARHPVSTVLFSGSADAARTLLSAIAGSLLTVLSISFSLTMIALQQASSQFSPRILRSITASAVNQTVVGAFAGTFVYALLVLRTVRSDDTGPEFVPALSVTVAVAMSLVCIALLVYFIHHVSQSLQVSVVITRLRDTLLRELDGVYPDRVAEPADTTGGSGAAAWAARLAAGAHSRVTATTGGFVRDVDEDALDEALGSGAPRSVHVVVGIGEFVPRGGLVAIAAPPLDDDALDAVRAAVVLADERTDHRDPAFVVQQLVDVGLRAMSPGVNDPTTAEHVLLHLGDALTAVAGRDLPDPLRQLPGGSRALLERADWDDLVDVAFSQLRRAAEGDVRVTVRLLEVLARLAGATGEPGRRAALAQQVADAAGAAERCEDWTDGDRERVREALSRARGATTG
ncbi:DUF2254 domain-containing protein [Kineococcus sp. SYSU DK004]|uniref:DUF2254 domain-containing protein n=1 Tax=Kineococcus sp. SYSU DK004 TaxID=3383125 RepID=UPI003D7DE310